MRAGVYVVKCGEFRSECKIYECVEVNEWCIMQVINVRERIGQVIRSPQAGNGDPHFRQALQLRQPLAGQPIPNEL